MRYKLGNMEVFTRHADTKYRYDINGRLLYRYRQDTIKCEYIYANNKLLKIVKGDTEWIPIWEGDKIVKLISPDATLRDVSYYYEGYIMTSNWRYSVNLNTFESNNDVYGVLVMSNVKVLKYGIINPGDMFLI